MIGKKPAKRYDGGSDFKAAIKYIKKDGNKEKATSVVALNCLSAETAAIEMRAVSSANTRVKDPLFHYILSWPENEKPTDEQAIEAGKKSLVKFGLVDHQAMLAVHRDTNNTHIHVVANIVNPDSLLVQKIEYRALEIQRVCREIEIEQGWSHEKNGVYQVEEMNGEKFVTYHPEMVGQKESQKEKEFKKHTGLKSFGDYVEETGKNKDLRVASRKNWLEFHQALAKHNLSIEPRGGGYVIVDMKDPGKLHAQAGRMGSWSKAAALEKKLGEFKPMLAGVKKDIANGSKKKYGDEYSSRSGKSAAEKNLYVRFTDEKNKFYSSKPGLRKKELIILKKKHDGKWKEIIKTCNAERKNKMATTAPQDKKFLSSVLAMKRAGLLNEHAQIKKSERKSVNEKYRNMKFESWRQWIRLQASNGDIHAEKAYKKLKYKGVYKDDLKGSEGEKTEIDTSLQDIVMRPFDGVDAQFNHLEKSTDFFIFGQLSFSDHGQSISIHDLESEEALEAALFLAAQKWRGIEITTDDELLRENLLIKAVELGINITNPELQDRIKELKELNKPDWLKKKESEADKIRQSTDLRVIAGHFGYTKKTDMDDKNGCKVFNLSNDCGDEITIVREEDQDKFYDHKSRVGGDVFAFIAQEEKLHLRTGFGTIKKIIRVIQGVSNAEKRKDVVLSRFINKEPLAVDYERVNRLFNAASEVSMNNQVLALFPKFDAKKYQIRENSEGDLLVPYFTENKLIGFDYYPKQAGSGVGELRYGLGNTIGYTRVVMSDSSLETIVAYENEKRDDTLYLSVSSISEEEVEKFVFVQKKKGIEISDDVLSLKRSHVRL